MIEPKLRVGTPVIISLSQKFRVKKVGVVTASIYEHRNDDYINTLWVNCDGEEYKVPKFMVNKIIFS